MKKIIIAHCMVLSLLNIKAQNEPYRGGYSDGHASSGMTDPFDEPIHFQVFKGGNADGHAADSMVNLVFAYPPQFYAFLGGETDGWAGTLVTTIVLPIHILQFNGYARDKANKLVWTTTSELNGDHFSIEKSKDGSNYDSIGRVAAAGYSNTVRMYDFTDTTPYPGNNFYRLKMTDKTGYFEYSQVVLLHTVAGNFNISAYPNPVKDILKLELPQYYNITIPCRIIDVAGKTIFSAGISAGNTQYIINVNKLARGNYYLQLQLPDGMKVIQFTK